jgi:hypothetical protein
MPFQSIRPGFHFHEPQHPGTNFRPAVLALSRLRGIAHRRLREQLILEQFARQAEPLALSP